MRYFLIAASIALLAACSAVADSTTLAEFEQVQSGMSLEEVVAILGEGEQVSSMEVGGAVAEIYIWKNPAGSSMTVSMADGVVSSKAQSGLK